MPASDRCAHIRTFLPELAAGELAPSLEEACRLHLAVCPACRAEAELARRSQRVLLGAAPSPPPPGLAERICATARKAPGRAWRPVPWAYAGGLAAVAAVAVLGPATWQRPARQGPKVVEPPPSSQGAASRPEASPSPVRADLSSVIPGPSLTPAQPQMVARARLPGSTARIGPRREARRTEFRSFLDVRDQSGMTARRLFANARSEASEAAAPGSTMAHGPRMAVPGRPVFGQPRSEGSLEVGGARLRTGGEAGWDSNGRLAEIRLEARPDANEQPDAPVGAR